MSGRPPGSTLFPYTTLSDLRSERGDEEAGDQPESRARPGQRPRPGAYLRPHQGIHRHQWRLSLVTQGLTVAEGREHLVHRLNDPLTTAVYRRGCKAVSKIVLVAACALVDADGRALIAQIGSERC